MNALISSAFSLEAYFNHLGQLLFAFWSTIERSLGPDQKLAMICSALSLAPDFGARPYQSVRTLFRFRNALAHGKTETVQDTWEEPLNQVTGRRAETDWQKQCTLEVAKRCHEDAVALIRTLHTKAGYTGDPLATLAEGMTQRYVIP